MEEELTQYLTAQRYPSGFGLWIGETKDTVFGRYIIVDNSRSMLTRDGHLLVEAGASAQPCTRWKMIGATLQTMAEIADAAQSPIEITLLNKEKSNAVVVGIRRDDGASLEAVQSLLDTTPIGNTPVRMPKPKTTLPSTYPYLLSIDLLLLLHCYVRYAIIFDMWRRELKQWKRHCGNKTKRRSSFSSQMENQRTAMWLKPCVH